MLGFYTINRSEQYCFLWLGGHTRFRLFDEGLTPCPEIATGMMLESRRKGRFQTVEDILSKTDRPMTLEEIEDSLPNISTYILKKSLKTMIAQGKVKKLGNTKGTRYKLNHR